VCLAATYLFALIWLFQVLLILFFFHPNLTCAATITATHSAPLLFPTSRSGQTNTTAPPSGGSTHALAPAMLTFY